MPSDRATSGSSCDAGGNGRGNARPPGLAPQHILWISSPYMETRHLAAFCAVVDRRSFSQAAERLGVTQPAVSLQVRSLEKRLGAQLLDRSGRRVEPTEAGWGLSRGSRRLGWRRGWAGLQTRMRMDGQIIKAR